MENQTGLMRDQGVSKLVLVLVLKHCAVWGVTMICFLLYFFQRDSNERGSSQDKYCLFYICLW